MMNDIERILLTEEQIQKKVKELGGILSRKFEGKNPLVIGILKGSTFFISDLAKNLTIPCTFDYMAASSYGAATVSSGKVNIKKDIDADVRGRDVIIAEDIIDSGNTLSCVVRLFKERGAASVTVCTLLDKPARRTADISAEYTGFTIEDEFVVGYGLDYNEHYRNLPFIGVLKPRVYQNV